MRARKELPTAERLHEILYHPLVLISYLQMKEMHEKQTLETNEARQKEDVYKIWENEIRMRGRERYYTQRTNTVVRVIELLEAVLSRGRGGGYYDAAGESGHEP